MQADNGLCVVPRIGAAGKARRRVASIVALAAIVLLVTIVPAAAGEAVRVRSRHYTIYTTVQDRETLRTYGRHMDAVFDAYRHRFRRFRPRHGGHMPLMLFKTREEYRAHLERLGIDARNSGGMFFVTPREQGLATWVDGRGREEVFDVLQHEGFHQFAWNYLGPLLPQWVNEGLAQYFEDGILVGETFKTGLADARRIRLVKQALADRRAFAVPYVLAVDHDDWNRTLANAPASAELLYAQSWSMAFFLIHGDEEKYQRHFSAYLRLLSRGDSSSTAFRRAFGMEDLSPMQRRWAEFARQHRPDPITLATERMGFLAAGLRWLSEHGAPPPDTIEALKRTLQSASFRLVRNHHSGSYEMSADDPTLYGFEVRGAFKPFVLLEPSAAGLPPRISAQGLDPEPSVVWHAKPDGGVVEAIEYR